MVNGNNKDKDSNSHDINNDNNDVNNSNNGISISKPLTSGRFPYWEVV